uniref:SFRICE_039220 n=1 Tax=Spodoptera frugiperda TaxID=7108 RepID=A0A2H1WXN1_SPOFR
MQRRNSLTLRTADSVTSDPLDVALTKPDDELLFYTASVHFLRKRLEEKSHQPSKPQEATQSCCNLSRPPVPHLSSSSLHKIAKIELDHHSPVGEGPSLSMQQVLPFPKSNENGFLTRLMNTFRKFRRPAEVTEQQTEEPDTKNISNFKFPRCSRLRNPRSSCLVEISEENSNENIRAPNVRHSTSSKGDLSEEKKSLDVGCVTCSNVADISIQAWKPYIAPSISCRTDAWGRVS